MRKMILALSLWTITGAHANTLNERKIGVTYTPITYTSSDFSGEVKPSIIFFKFSSNLGDNFDLESRIGFGVQDDYLGSGTLSMDNVFGLYAKFHTPEEISPYFIVGSSWGSATYTSRFGQTETYSESDLSFGAGIDVKSFNAEFMQYMNKDGFKISGISVGFNIPLN